MITNPHDALFKFVFSQPEHARGTLRTIAPAALREALDWSTLALQPGSFVDSVLSEQHTDLLYSASTHDGREVFVYLLFEHQSAPPTEGLMAYRLLAYQVRIWDRWRKDHPKTRSLPPIVPLVMYHGAVTWSEPLSFGALLDVPVATRPGLDPHLVEFSYLLCDLSEISDGELRWGAMSALAKLVAMCFKYGRTRADFLEILSRWSDVVGQVIDAPRGLDALATVMRYVLVVNEHVAREALTTFLVREIGPQAKDAIVTAGQQLIEQGRQQGMEQGRQQGMEQGRQQGIEQGRQQGIEQGRQQGIEQGIEQGRHEGAQQLLLHLLRQRFGAEVDAGVEQRVATASTHQIEAWSLRVLSAAKVADVLA